MLTVSYYRGTTYGLWVNTLIFILINSSTVIIIWSLINIYVIFHGGDKHVIIKLLFFSKHDTSFE